MGLDIRFQSMPNTCRLLARSRHDPDFGANLEFFKSYALTSQEELDHRVHDQRFVEFVHEARQAVEHYPRIEHRNLYLGRRWDMLYYLLSERRRECEAAEEGRSLHQSSYLLLFRLLSSP